MWKTGSDKQLEDQQLARAASAGDTVAQRKIVARLIEPTRRKLSYLTRNTTVVEDLTQVALMKTLEKTHTFRGECSLEHWSGKIALRIYMKYFAKKKRRSVMFSQYAEQELTVAQTARFEMGDDILDRKNLTKKLARVLERLSLERRIVVVMHTVAGYTVPEISATTDASEHTVRDRLRKGRQQLRKYILADPEIRDWVGAWRK